MRLNSHCKASVLFRGSCARLLRMLSCVPEGANASPSSVACSRAERSPSHDSWRSASIAPSSSLGGDDAMARVTPT